MNATPTATVPNKLLSLAEDLAEYQESRRRKPGLRPPGRPRKVREVAP